MSKTALSVDGSYRSAGYQTPKSVADQLAKMVWKAARGRFHFSAALDACAGSGALTAALLKRHGGLQKVTLLDVDPEVLKAISIPNEAGVEVVRKRVDLLKNVSDFELCDPALIVCNPPYVGFRECNLAERQVIRDLGLPQYNDLATAFLLRIVQASPSQSIFGFVIRRDILFSRGYATFRSRLAAFCTLVSCTEIGRRLMPGSGRAIGVLIVLRKRKVPAKTAAQFDRFLTRHIGCAGFSPERLGQLGLIPLGLLAHVVAGPNTGADSQFLHSMKSNRTIVRLPPSTKANEIWGPMRAVPIYWNEDCFKARRNMRSQGKPGAVYRLCGSDFVSGVLPDGMHFLSATPAILPIAPEWLHLITGVVLLSSWRRYARKMIQSTNFTPGAVAELHCPAPGSIIAKRIETVGMIARQIVNMVVASQHPPSTLLLRLNYAARDADSSLAKVLALDWNYVSFELPSLSASP